MTKKLKNKRLFGMVQPNPTNNTKPLSPSEIESLRKNRKAIQQYAQEAFKNL